MSSAIDTLREELSTLGRKGHVTGPAKLFLARLLDHIESQEKPASSVSGQVPWLGSNSTATHNCPACAERTAHKAREDWAIGAKV